MNSIEFNDFSCLADQFQVKDILCGVEGSERNIDVGFLWGFLPNLGRVHVGATMPYQKGGRSPFHYPG